jgi:hypothetical protein
MQKGKTDSLLLFRAVGSRTAGFGVRQFKRKVKSGGQECPSHVRVSICTRMDSRGRLSPHVSCSGYKARLFFLILIGTTEVVPFPVLLGRVCRLRRR